MTVAATVELIPALTMFDELLSRQLVRAGADVRVSACDGSTFALELPSWCSPADEIDRSALARLAAQLPERAAVIDLACGPGRHARHLASVGMRVLGVDLAPAAAARTRSGQVAALCHDIFAPLPAQGRWDAVLLMDGNIGIAGDPSRLLHRARRLLAPQGRILIELDGEVSDRRMLQLHDGQRSSTPFAWARVSATDLRDLAAGRAMEVVDLWQAGSRTFAILAAR